MRAHAARSDRTGGSPARHGRRLARSADPSGGRAPKVGGRGWSWALAGGAVPEVESRTASPAASLHGGAALSSAARSYFEPRSGRAPSALPPSSHTVRQRAGLGLLMRQPREDRPEEERSPRPRRTAALARREAAEALDRALELVDEAIAAAEEGAEIPQAVRTALARFFPGETAEFLPLLRRRGAAVRRIITGVRIRAVFRRADPAIDPLGPELNALLASGLPAVALPLDTPTFIAVTRRFYRERELQSTRLIHECFHVIYPFVRHRGRRVSEPPRANAFAYQGFFSLLAGLPQERPLELYPEPEP